MMDPGKFQFSSDSPAMQQAQNIWSMLDDMADSDPSAYRKFIERHLKEGKEMMQPPQPHMCIVTQTKESPSRALSINVLGWNRIPAPKSEQDPIPIMAGSMLQYTNATTGLSEPVVSVCVNPDMLERYGRSAKTQEEQDCLVHLIIDYLDDQHQLPASKGYAILSKKTKFRGELNSIVESFNKKAETDQKQFEENLSEIEESFGPMAAGCKDSLLSQLSNIGIGEDKQSQATNQCSPGIHINQSQATNPRSPGLHIKTKETPTKRGLIQEIKTEVAPQYTISFKEKDNGQTKLVVVKISLAGVKSVSECELDISEDELCLLVEGKYDLKLPLPQKILETEARAKFSTKSSSLTVTLPVLF